MRRSGGPEAGIGGNADRDGRVLGLRTLRQEHAVGDLVGDVLHPDGFGPLEAAVVL